MDRTEANARMIWSAGGFLSPANGPSSPLNSASNLGLGATSPSRTTELPAVRVPPGSVSARSWVPDGGSSAVGFGSPLDSPRCSSMMYELPRAKTANGNGRPPRSEDVERRRMKRRNKQLETELRRSLNLYGETLQYMTVERQQQAVKEQEAREREVVLDQSRQERENEWREELARVHAECDAKLAAAADERVALQAELQKYLSESELQEVELQARLAKQKEKQVEHLKKQAARRMKQGRLFKGWKCWHEMWEEVVRQRNLLRAAAMRLSAPAKSAAFAAQWRQSGPVPL